MNATDKPQPPLAPRARPSGWLKPALLLLAVLALYAASHLLPLSDWVHTFLEYVRSMGVFGPVVLGIAYIASCVLLVPGFILTLGAGVLFGVTVGTITVSIASTIGATIAFLIGRHLARDAVAARIAKYPLFHAIDEAVASEGWKIVALVRLSPLFPFILVNYAFGLTQVSLRAYVVASWIAMTPATLLYVYLGALFGDVAALGGGERSRTPVEWVFYALGLAATIAVTLYVTRIARRALTNTIEANGEDDPR